jgi:DNA-binding transcriptional ArsR family regulator
MPARARPLPRSGLAIGRLARVLAEPSRVAMLDALLDGDGHAVGALARAAGVSAATASSHVRALADANLVAVDARGRERVVRLADADVAYLLEQLAALSAASVERRPRDELRFARTCYDHLAGVLAILVVQALVDRRWLHATTDNLEPAPALLAWLADHGHPVDDATTRGKRPLSRACVDWTERLPHVAGRVGAALAAVFVDGGWVARVRDTRALRVTERGRHALARELGLTLTIAQRG